MSAARRHSRGGRQCGQARPGRSSRSPRTRSATAGRAACGRARTAPAMPAGSRKSSAVRHGSKNLAGELSRKQHGPFGMETGARILRASGEGEKVLGMALLTADGRATALEAVHRPEDHQQRAPRRAQGSGTRFEGFLVRAHLAVQVVLKKLVESGSLRGSGTIDCGRVRNARIIPAARRHRRIRLPTPVPQPAQNKRGMT